MTAEVGHGRAPAARSWLDAEALAGLDARAQRELQAAATQHRLAPRQRLYAQSERADSFFVVASGQIDLAAQRRSGAGEPVGDRILVRSVLAGASFGEEASVTARRHTDAFAGPAGAIVVEIPIHLFRRAIVRSGRADLADKMERTLRRGAARDAIGGTPLSQSLNEEGIEAVVDAVTFHTFARNQPIYRAGDASVGLFVVVDGLVQIQTEEDERIRVQGYVGRGDFFGDEELEEATPRSASAIANGPTVLVSVPARVVRALAARDGDLFVRLRRVALGVGARQQGIIRREVKNATQHVFRDLYRVHVARSLLVIDLETCVRCGHCSWACGSLYGTSRLIRRGDKIVTRGALAGGRGEGTFDVFAGRDLAQAPTSLLLPSSCQHCENPACMVDCPTGAIGKDESGEVFIREELCTGCGACARACPWTNIQMTERPAAAPRPAGVAADLLATKCDLCRTYERGPACVQVCPTSAIQRIDPQKEWGEVAALLGRGAGGRGASAGTSSPAPMPAWSAVLGGALAATGVALAGAVMRARGHWAPHRGLGYAAGVAAAVTMIALLAYVAPKRLVSTWMKLGRRRTGAKSKGPRERVQSVTRPHYVVHLALGLLSVGFAIAHAPHDHLLAATRGSALLVALYLAGASGAAMAATYAFAPKALSKIERTPLLPEDFAKERGAMSARLYKSLSGKDDLVKAVASRVLLPYAKSFLGPVLLVASGRDLRAEEQHLRVRIDTALEGRGKERLTGLDDLVRLAVELRALPAQRFLTTLLRVFLPIHIVAFTIACVLGVLHVLGVSGYRGGP